MCKQAISNHVRREVSCKARSKICPWLTLAEASKSVSLHFISFVEPEHHHVHQ